MPLPDLQAALELTLSQQFNLQRITQDTEKLQECDIDIARGYIVNLAKQLMLKDNIVRELLKRDL